MPHSDTNSSKYVEGGIEGLIAAMAKQGANKSRLIVRIIGGANMLLSSGLTRSFDIGTRNVEAAHTTLNRLKMPILASDVGGHTGRTVRVYVAENRVTVRVIGQKEHEI
jgi:chemotaxis protein CheD